MGLAAPVLRRKARNCLDRQVAGGLPVLINTYSILTFLQNPSPKFGPPKISKSFFKIQKSKIESRNILHPAPSSVHYPPSSRPSAAPRDCPLPLRSGFHRPPPSRSKIEKAAYGSRDPPEHDGRGAGWHLGRNPIFWGS